MTTMFHQYPDIEFPEFLIRLGFLDYSYRNDACARAELLLTSDRNAEFPVLQAWVDYDEAREREVEGSHKYTVLLHCDDSGIAKETVYEGEDASVCETAIRTWLEVNTSDNGTYSQSNDLR